MNLHIYIYIYYPNFKSDVATSPQVLDDHLIMDLQPSHFVPVLKPKIDGTLPGHPRDPRDGVPPEALVGEEVFFLRIFWL